MLKRIGILTFLVILGWTLFAEKPLERIANETAVEGESLFGEGKYIEAAGKFEQALAQLQEAVKADGIPLDEEKVSSWLYNAYQSYLNAREFDNAVRIIDQRIARDPDDYDLTKNKAILLAKYLDKPDDAITVLISFDKSNNSLPAKKLTASYYENYKQDAANALIWYQKAFDQKQDSKILQNIATLHKNLGNNQQAIKAYEDYINTNPDNSKLIATYKNLATLYDDLDNPVKAVEYFEKANALQADDKIVLLLVTRYYDMRNFEKSLQKVNELLKIKPASKDAIYYRALNNYELGQNDLAQNDFEKLVNDSKYGKSAQGFIESIKSEK
ncbi:MAG: tetratricopeptide repeat protein [Candidatus Cloacimonetes bacterium]|nr:tetratricopeptide repeat protein [Candidatus Cloacimonadota bacterium]